MTGAQLFVRELQKRGVAYIAALCGNGLDPLFNASHEEGRRLVDVRNEQAAGYMAEVTGRLSRRVGVCAASSGVAHVNALTGVVNAYFDGAPMLLITGSSPFATIGLEHFQDLDHVALAAPVCKYARIVDCAERIPHFIHEAFTAATAGRPGPVQLTLPLDIQAAEVEVDRIIKVPESSPTAPDQTRGAEPLIAKAADLLQKAERPLLVAGSGLYYAEGEENLARFVHAFSIPVVVPIWDRGTINGPIDEFVGVIGAATGGPRLLLDADLILMMGARCDYRVGYLQPPTIREDAQIIRIDVDPHQLRQGVGAHLSILADPGSALSQLSDACTNREMPPKTAWLQEARSRRTQFHRTVLNTAEKARDELHAADIMEAVQSVLTDDTMVLVDGGNIGQWAHQLLHDRYPGHWLTCGASGVVGWGIPGAMAARLLYPDRPIILISGDGSIGFTIAEFESATRQNLPFVVLLADDQAWGIVLTGHQEQFSVPIGCELGPIRYDQIAEAFGAHGVRIESAAEILPALKQGLSADRPTLIHVPIVRSNPADQ